MTTRTNANWWRRNGIPCKHGRSPWLLDTHAVWYVHCALQGGSVPGRYLLRLRWCSVGLPTCPVWLLLLIVKVPGTESRTTGSRLAPLPHWVHTQGRESPALFSIQVQGDPLFREGSGIDGEHPPEFFVLLFQSRNFRFAFERPVLAEIRGTFVNKGVDEGLYVNLGTARLFISSIRIFSDHTAVQCAEAFRKPLQAYGRLSLSSEVVELILGVACQYETFVMASQGELMLLCCQLFDGSTIDTQWGMITKRETHSVIAELCHDGFHSVFVLFEEEAELSVLVQ